VIGIQADGLKPELRDRGRNLGILIAMVIRLGLLFVIGPLARLSSPIAEIPLLQHAFSWKDLIFLIGGGYLAWEASKHLYEHTLAALEEGLQPEQAKHSQLAMVLGQIAWTNLLFSIDSVMTVVGFNKPLPVMIAAVVLSTGVMLLFAKPLSSFIERNQIYNIYALCLMLLVGFKLIWDASGHHIPDGTFYFGIGFSAFVVTTAWKARTRLLRGKARPRPVVNCPSCGSEIPLQQIEAELQQGG